jgi:threonine aldolase
MTDEGLSEAERRLAAIGACDRVLSHGKPASMRERLAALLEGGRDLDAVPDQYGDGIVRRLEERVAGLLGKPDAAFFPTGTMAQQAVLRCWAQRGGSPVVALHPMAHPEEHEEDALSVLTGLRTIHPTTAPRLPDAAEVRDAAEPFCTLMLELPLRDAGFVLPSWDELIAVVQAARDRNAFVHFDGARLWESTVHFGRGLEEISALADSVYVSFYKSLGGLSGAAVAGPADLIAEAKTWRHRYGGLLYQQFPAVIAAMNGLDTELPRLPSYVAHAAMVAAALRGAFTGTVPWFRIHPAVPHTHQFAVWLPYPAGVVNEAVRRQAEQTGVSLFRGWASTDLPDVAKAEVQVSASALDWTAADVEAAARSFVACLGLCAWPAAAAAPDDQLDWQVLGVPRQRRILEPLQQAGAGALAQQPHRLPYGGQAHHRGGVDVVEPDHRDVGRYPHPGRLQRADGAERHLVVGAHDRVRQFRPRPAEQFPHRQLPAHGREPALERSRDGNRAVSGHRLMQGGVPLEGVRCRRRPGDLVQAPHAVHRYQVLDKGRGPPAVVGDERIGIRLVHRPGDQHDRDPGREPSQLLEAEGALDDEHAVDLRRDLLDPPQGRGRVVVMHEGDEQRPLGIPQCPLDAALHHVPEQQPLCLDVGVGTAAVHGEQPDDLLALPCHALRGTVGEVAERLDHVQHPLAGSGTHPFQVVEHPRDGSGGDISLTRHVMQGNSLRHSESGRLHEADVTIPVRPAAAARALPVPPDPGGFPPGWPGTAC